MVIAPVIKKVNNEITALGQKNHLNRTQGYINLAKLV
jgi:hypothetical protein